MADDWQPGDLALCVNAEILREGDGRISSGRGLSVGGVYTVSRCARTKWGYLGLCLEGVDDGRPKRAIRFRRIRPHTPDEEDRETIELLKGGKVHA